MRGLPGSEFRVPPRKSLAEKAADQLRERILTEKLAPGLPGPERDLADGMGNTRTPLREALRILEGEGLIEYSATRRPRVANPSMEVIANNLDVICSLEALAGELARERATAAEIEPIRGLCRNMEVGSSTVPALKFFSWDMEFHALVVTASRNPPLIGTHRQYNARLWPAQFISSRMQPRRASTLQQHAEILSAVAARNATATNHALRSHLKTAVDNSALARRESKPSEAAE